MAVTIRLDRQAMEYLIERQGPEFEIQLTAAVISKAADYVVKKGISDEIQARLDEMAASWRRLVCDEVGRQIGEKRGYRGEVHLTPGFKKSVAHEVEWQANKLILESGIQGEIKDAFARHAENFKEWAEKKLENSLIDTVVDRVVESLGAAEITITTRPKDV